MKKDNIDIDEDLSEWDVTLMDGLENEPPYYETKTNNMKILIHSLLYSLLIFGLFYLIGSFIETTFDIREWDTASRSVVGVFGGFASILVGGIYFGSSKYNNQI